MFRGDTSIPYKQSTTEIREEHDVREGDFTSWGSCSLADLGLNLSLIIFPLAHDPFS